MLRDLHEELLRCQQEIDAGLFQTHPKINVFTRLVSDATSNRKNKCLIIIEHEQLGSEIIVALNRNPETHLEIGTITENMTQSQMYVEIVSLFGSWQFFVLQVGFDQIKWYFDRASHNVGQEHGISLFIFLMGDWVRRLRSRY